MVKNLPAMWETWVQCLSWEDPLERGTETHSSILAWRIPWAEEPGKLQSMGLKRVGHDWVTLTFTIIFTWSVTSPSAPSQPLSSTIFSLSIWLCSPTKGACMLLRVRTVIVTVTLGMVNSPLPRRIPEGNTWSMKGKENFSSFITSKNALTEWNRQLSAFVPSNMLWKYKKTPIGGC